MLYCTILAVRCSSQNNANTLVTGVTNQLVNKQVASIQVQPVAALEDGAWTVRGIVRFGNRADAESWHATATLEIGSNKILTGTLVTTHDCPHDAVGGGACVPDLVTSK
jgi:hypothetical protein